MLLFFFIFFRPAVSTKPAVDPTQWKLEVERAAPLLKIHITNDNKDWRVHLDQINIHNNVRIVKRKKKKDIYN